MHLVDVFRAKIVDISEDTVTIEVISSTSLLSDILIIMLSLATFYFRSFQGYR